MKKTKNIRMKTKLKKKIIEKPKYQSDTAKEEHGRQSRVKFWIGDFIDNESTPVETRTGVEVKIDNVNENMKRVCGYVYNSSYRELREWDYDGVYLEDWGKMGDPSFDLFFSSTGKNTTSYDINLRPYTYDELCDLHRGYLNGYLNRGYVLEKDTKEPFLITYITELVDKTYSVELCNCNKRVTVFEKELLEHYTWPDGNPCGIKRGRS